MQASRFLLINKESPDGKSSRRRHSIGDGEIVTVFIDSSEDLRTRYQLEQVHSLQVDVRGKNVTQKRKRKEDKNGHVKG